jgi:hypothetical protein
MRALALLLLAEAAALADSTVPQKPASGPLVMLARVRGPLPRAPHCGVLAVASIVRFDVLRVMDGAWSDATVDVGFQCVESYDLRVGQVRRLALTSSPRHTSFGWSLFDARPEKDRPRVLWAREAKPIPGYSDDDDRCRAISVDDDGCPDPIDYTRTDLPDLLDQLVREPRLARFRLVGARSRVMEMTRWLMDAGIPRGRFIQDGRDGVTGLRFAPER